MAAVAGAPDPSRTLAILFGASRWPQFEGLDDPVAARTYAAAADEFRSYLLDEDGFGLLKDNLLDLFDSTLGVIEQDRRIRDFVLTKCKQTATIQDLVLMYVGHGSTMQDNKFIFILASTSRDQREISAYKSESLGKTLKQAAPRLRKWIILDCCAAQAAYGDFQPASDAATVLEGEALQAFPPDGAAFYAACSSSELAYNDPETGSRMFTAALIGVLRKGDPKLSEHLTLSEVASLTREEINRRHGTDAVRPYIGDPDQRKGELSSLPFFPNAARRKTSLEAQLTALQDSVSTLQRRLDEGLDEMRAALDQQNARHEALAREVADLPVSAPGPEVSGTAPAGTSPLADVDARLATLTLEEQRRWDEALTGRRVSTFILAWSAVLLWAAISLLAASFIQPPTAYHNSVIVIGASLAAIAAFVTSALAAMAVRPDPAAPAQLPSPALEALLRTNSHFRGVYCADYRPTPLGLLLRRSMILASIFALIAAGLSTFVTVAQQGIV